MRYQLLLLDIDGTLRPHGQACIPAANVAAVAAVQAAGVRVAVATGRGRASVTDRLMNGLHPDYWLCAAGAQVVDAAGTPLYEKTMTAAAVEAVTQFCAEHGWPVRFTFADGSYAYVGYEVFAAQEARVDHGIALKDGSARTRHQQSLPYSAYGAFPPGAAAAFAARWPGLGLRFFYEGGAAFALSDVPASCDILPAGVDKADGLRVLCAAAGIGPAACAAVGDSDNDAPLLRAAGLGVCVAGGSAAALAAADRVGLPAEENAVAALCRELWPEAFA